MHAFGFLHSVRKVKYLQKLGKWIVRVNNTVLLKLIRVEYALVANFLDVEETTLRTDVGLSKVFYSVDDGGANCSRDTIVVRFTHTSHRGDVGF